MDQLHGEKFNMNIQMSIQVCINCGIVFAITKKYEDQLRKSHESFYCPNKHSQYYSSESDAEKLKKQLKQSQCKFEEKESCCNRLESTVKHQEHVINGYKGQVTKLGKKKSKV